MRAIVLFKNFEAVMPEARLVKRRRRWALGLAVSCMAAFLTGLVGLVLGAISLLHLVPADRDWGIYGPVLLMVAFPLMILAAHCMDKIDEVNAVIRCKNDSTQ
jgi:cytochrome c biogenesis protein CcdA